MQGHADTVSQPELDLADRFIDGLHGNAEFFGDAMIGQIIGEAHRQVFFFLIGQFFQAFFQGIHLVIEQIGGGIGFDFFVEQFFDLRLEMEPVVLISFFVREYFVARDGDAPGKKVGAFPIFVEFVPHNGQGFLEDIIRVRPVGDQAEYISEDLALIGDQQTHELFGFIFSHNKVTMRRQKRPITQQG